VQINIKWQLLADCNYNDDDDDEVQTFISVSYTIDISHAE